MMKPDNLVNLELIDKAIMKIVVYTKDIDEKAFLKDEMMQDACLMQLIVIGENCGRISQDIKERFSEVEWQLIKAARNFFAHAYGYIKWSRIWDTIQTVVPDLKPKIEHIIEVLEKENNGETN